MREESHLDDMRSAIRGDFERLEQRHGKQELMHLVPREAPLEEHSCDAEPASEAEPPPRRSWLDRLLSR